MESGQALQCQQAPSADPNPPYLKVQPPDPCVLILVKIKKELLYLKCKACGFLSDVDPRHKLNTFILKNPPENKMTKEEKKCV